MHTHIRNENDLLPYFANGVSNMLNNGSLFDIIVHKKEARLQRILSTTIYASGFVAGIGQDGFIGADLLNAIELVYTKQSEGWDFVKVNNSIPTSAYKALIKLAKEKNSHCSWCLYNG